MSTLLGQRVQPSPGYHQTLAVLPAKAEVFAVMASRAAPPVGGEPGDTVDLIGIDPLHGLEIQTPR